MPPMKKWNAGQVSCALWNNEIKVDGRSVSMLKASVERRYKVGEEWRSSNSFSRNEIPLAIYCLQQAFAAMIEKREQDEHPQVEEEVVVE